ncbi:MAG: calcium/sodium antiporter [Bacteroidales bacterium]|nr:calcium/sodium antiporter [Bacteroidales bacterium]
MDYIYLILGIILLLFAGNQLVKSGSSIAEYFKIPPFIVGVTVVSLGTSAPELFVSLNAALANSPDIAIGNIVGSNIANIGLVLALTAIVISIPVKKSTIRFDYPVLLIASILFAVFMGDLLITRIEGAIMIFLMLVYLFLIIKMNHKKKSEKQTIIVEEKTSGTLQKSPWISVLLILISCGGLLLGSNILVEGAGNIAKNLGVSERIISITVIAFGTSIPELATSIIAAFKKQIDIGLGNIIGSNIFNILVISGISSVVTPLSVNPSTMNFDIYFLLGFVVLTGLFFLPFRKAQITRWKGFVYLFAYFGYYIVLFYN